MVGFRTRTEKMLSFLDNSYIRIVVMLSLIVLNLLIFVLPYVFYRYAVPVGWDKAWYIRNMRLIEEQGLFTFFQELHQVNLFSILEYVVSSVFNISFMLTAMIIPIILVGAFPLVNFQIVHKLTKSWQPSLVAMIFTIVDYNIIRMVGASLDRNLFCLLLLEIALFIILPKLLEKTSKKGISLFILLQVLAGLSQMETFALSSLVLIIFFVSCMKRLPFHKVKLLFLCVIISFVFVILFEAPFIAGLLETHIALNPSVRPERQGGIAHPISYLLSLGSGLILFFVVGLYRTLQNFKDRSISLSLLISLWNLTVIIGSFIPLFGPRIPSWRFLLLITVPPLAAIGLADFFVKETPTIKAMLATMTMVTITCTVIIVNQYVTYKPWISNEEYLKLIWIDNNKRNSSLTFVLYYDRGERATYEWAELHRHWIWATIGTKTNVYFGEVDYLLKSQPTPFEDWYTNRTSYVFWNAMKNFSVNDTQIYLIVDWYEGPLDQKHLREVNEGIYQVEADQNGIYKTQNRHY